MCAARTAKTTTTQKSAAPVAHGVGRRKASVARVFARPRGTGKVVVNGRPMETYFDTEIARLSVRTPLMLIKASGIYDFEVNVCGGGLNGQADAVRLGISRALLEADAELRTQLREYGLLTVDARVKERKKYGQKAARRRFQFVKR